MRRENIGGNFYVNYPGMIPLGELLERRKKRESKKLTPTKPPFMPKISPRKAP